MEAYLPPKSRWSILIELHGIKPCHRYEATSHYYYYIITIIIIYFNCKWVYTRWQSYYNKTHTQITQRSNETQHTKLHTQ
jgi:hypothetical protein